MDNTVLLMLSGGRDSFLSACRLLEDTNNYNIKMVTYDNGCSYMSENARLVAERIIKQYGKERAEYLGVYKISSVIREFFFPYFNMKPCEQAESYAGMTPSQFHCLVCRTSMYIYSILLCKKLGIHYIAEGGRKSQQFVIELPGMIKDRFSKLVQSEGLELLLPVYDMLDDWRRDNELMRRKFISKCYEAKCLIGVPVNGSIDETVIEGVHNYYDNEIIKTIEELQLLKNFAFLDNEYDELQP